MNRYVWERRRSMPTCRSFPDAANRKEYVYKRSTGKVAINSDSLSLLRAAADISSRERERKTREQKPRFRMPRPVGGSALSLFSPRLPVARLPSSPSISPHGSLFSGLASLFLFPSLPFFFPLDARMRAVRFIQMRESAE